MEVAIYFNVGITLLFILWMVVFIYYRLRTGLIVPFR